MTLALQPAIVGQAIDICGKIQISVAAQGRNRSTLRLRSAAHGRNASAPLMHAEHPVRTVAFGSCAPTVGRATPAM
jgi:hypothetical protein